MSTPMLIAVAGAALAALSLPAASASPSPLYQFAHDRAPRWSSPENPNGLPGQGAQLNHGAKGRASVVVPAGATHRLLDVHGAGVVTRIWLTLSDRSPAMLRSLRLEMFWDGAGRPAVSVPLGDFFGVGLGRTASFQNALFASPEGRSFVCTIPMPFRTAARIQVTNESKQDLTHLFYDVDFLATPTPGADDLYFHAYWHREIATTLARDFELLPGVTGRGRFLGVNVGVTANRQYEGVWWGEGEVKAYLDGDRDWPTLAGTGTEDYIGTAWGQGAFCNDSTGCLVADEKNHQWCFYRYHLADPIFFHHACRVTWQQIGGAPKAKIVELQRAGVPLIPITIDTNGTLRHLYDGTTVTRADDRALPEGWMNIYRSDDVSATAYFYLDASATDLPALQPVAERTADGSTRAE